MTAGQFLNVDLEIESKTDLAPLATELEPRGVAVLYCGPVQDGFLICLESGTWSGDSAGPDATIHDLGRIVEALSVAGQELWRSAFRREFDVGFDATAEHLAARFALRLDTLERIARLGATLAVTIYKAEIAPPEGAATKGGPSSSPA